ncbi:MAG: putative ABC transport system ATP-binding protein [Planctomycetota bacterium]
MSDERQDSIPVLNLEGVEKRYGEGDAAVVALHDINLRVEVGEFVGIVGASGSGKSTMLNLLGCLDKPTAGRYQLDGVDVSSLSDDALSKIRNQKIGFVFQSFHLIPELTVIENVEVPLFYAKTARNKRQAVCRELLETVGLGHRLRHRPNQLSGGERQRVAIARSLVVQPALVLADEPTGNLDSKNGMEVLELFYDLHAMGRTIVMVTHNPEIAGSLPRTVELKDGSIAQESRREPRDSATAEVQA